jgi:hypothetical protein
MNSIKRAVAVALACAAVSLSSVPPAQARLGESLRSFKSKAEHSYKFVKETKKEDRSYESFIMIVDNKLKESAPGFAVAETLTVVDGKIVGQSMVIRVGENYEGGKALATLHAMDFAYESIGKPPPNKQVAEEEFKQLQFAVDQVLVGMPQHIKYPHYKARITLSRSNEGELLVAATPDLSAPAEAKPAAAGKPTPATKPH